MPEAHDHTAPRRSKPKLPDSTLGRTALARRNLKKGQQAIALAMIYPDEGKRGRGNKMAPEKSAESAGFSERRLRQARAILRHSRALAWDVLADRTSLDATMKQVQEEQQRSTSAEARMQELRADAPDPVKTRTR